MATLQAHRMVERAEAVGMDPQASHGRQEEATPPLPHVRDGRLLLGQEPHIEPGSCEVRRGEGGREGGREGRKEGGEGEGRGKRGREGGEGEGMELCGLQLICARTCILEIPFV